MSHEGDEPSLPFIMFVLSPFEKIFFFFFFFANEDVSEGTRRGQCWGPLTHNHVSMQREEGSGSLLEVSGRRLGKKTSWGGNHTPPATLDVFRRIERKNPANSELVQDHRHQKAMSFLLKAQTQAAFH